MGSVKDYFSNLGSGIASLIKGMSVTGKEFVTPKITEEYPDNRDNLPVADRFRAVLRLKYDDQGDHKCIACGTCERVCPNGTISLDIKQVETWDGKKKKKLDKYMYDLGSCTFCQLCVTNCPTDALDFSNDFEQAVFTRGKLVKKLNYLPEKEEPKPTPEQKLGGYGCFRVAIYLMPQAAHELAWIFIILTGISVVYGAFSACVQNDLKYINAYSSVSHCGLVLFAILMLNTTAMTGAIMQMLSHGLMTALFFALIGMIYGRTHTRDIREMGGMMQILPYLSVCYVIAGMASLGLPGLSGFVAEMTIFVGSFQHTDLFHRVFVILACSSIVTTAVYILRVVGKLLYGPVYDQHHMSLTDAKWWERLSTATLIVCVAGIGCFPNFFADLIKFTFSPQIFSVLGLH